MIISRFITDGRLRQGLGRGGQDNVYVLYIHVYSVQCTRIYPEPLTIFARANFTTAIINSSSNRSSNPYYITSHPPPTSHKITLSSIRTTRCYCTGRQDGTYIVYLLYIIYDIYILIYSPPPFDGNNNTILIIIILIIIFTDMQTPHRIFIKI